MKKHLNKHMDFEKTFQLFEHVDIYVIDQILKKRYQPGESILDAGCGSGRNLKWFYHNNFQIIGIDADSERIVDARNLYPKASSNFTTGKLDNLPYSADSFDHILCCAVLHFAQSESHFHAMLKELIRVLKTYGTLLIRVASNIGLDGNKPSVQDGRSNEMGNFYITRELISSLLKTYPLQLIEPVKTTNVQDIRAMTTLVFQKR